MLKMQTQPMHRPCGLTIVVRGHSIAVRGRCIAVGIGRESVAVAGGMIFAWRRPTMCGRKIVSRTVDRTGKLIGNRIAEKIGAKIDGTTVGRMPGEMCGDWIVRIRWRASTGVKVGTMRGPRRWIAPIASSERNVRNGRSALSGRRDRNGRSGLRGPDEISPMPNIRSVCGTAPGDLPGAAMVLKLA